MQLPYCPAIVLSSRDIAAAWGKATHVVAIFPTDAHAFTEGKDDKTSKRSENGKTDKPMRNGHASLLAPHLADSILVRAAIIITVKSEIAKLEFVTCITHCWFS